MKNPLTENLMEHQMENPMEPKEENPYTTRLKDIIKTKPSATPAPPISTPVSTNGNGKHPPIMYSEDKGKKRPAELKLVSEERNVLIFRRGDLEYVVKDLKITARVDLRVFVKISFQETRHLQMVNFLSDRDHSRLVNALREKMGISELEVRSDIDKLTLLLEEIQERNNERRHEDVEDVFEKKYVILKDDEKKAMDNLAARDYLTETLLKDCEYRGNIGEENNKMIITIGGLSRLDDRPLHLLMVSRPGTGKSFTMKSTLDFFPEPFIVTPSRTTPQALFYMPKDSLSEKIVLIEEVHGAVESIYSLRIAMSERKLELLYTGKDELGNHRTFKRSVDAKCSFFFSTTNIETIDQETRSRMIVLFGDEGEKQTGDIMENQFFFGNTPEGKKRGGEFHGLFKKHWDMIAVIRGVDVYVHGEDMKKKILDRHKYLSERRNFPCLLTIINSIARSRMYQRKIETINGREAVYVTSEDFALAERLSKTIFKAHRDDMAGPVRLFYETIVAYVKSKKGRLKLTEVVFKEREIRLFCQWGRSQTQTYLKLLVDLEYLAVFRRGKGNQGAVFRLIDEP